MLGEIHFSCVILQGVQEQIINPKIGNYLNKHSNADIGCQI